ncbi:MAG: hypothetical protein J6S69_11110 [Proteobacteria bacterium]|nr:hypothetical protein [Pseudomonadota bacterium]
MGTPLSAFGECAIYADKVGIRCAIGYGLRHTPLSNRLWLAPYAFKPSAMACAIRRLPLQPQNGLHFYDGI